MNELTRDDLTRLQTTVRRGHTLSCADGQGLLDTIAARDTTMADLAKQYPDSTTVEGCQIKAIARLERDNLKMSEACLTVRDAAATFMRSRLQNDLETLEHAVTQINRLPEALCPHAFRIVTRLDDAERQITILREALTPLARLARSVHESRTQDFWFWKRSSTIESREFGVHADDALRAEQALAHGQQPLTLAAQREVPRP